MKGFIVGLAAINRLIFIALTAFGLVACGGGGGSSGSESNMQSVTVSASLGQIKKANVRLIDLASQIVIAEQEIGADGTATFMVPVSTGAFIAEVVGDVDAQYFDEGLGDYVDFPDPAKIRAVVSELQAEVGVTLLTELAAVVLEGYMGGVSFLQIASRDDINYSNDFIRDQFVIGLDDITEPPTIIHGLPVSQPGGTQALMGSSPADLYAYFLAVFNLFIVMEEAESDEINFEGKSPAVYLLDLGTDEINSTGTTNESLFNTSVNSNFSDAIDVIVNGYTGEDEGATAHTFKEFVTTPSNSPYYNASNWNLKVEYHVEVGSFVAVAVADAAIEEFFAPNRQELFDNNACAFLVNAANQAFESRVPLVTISLNPDPQDDVIRLLERSQSEVIFRVDCDTAIEIDGDPSNAVFEVFLFYDARAMTN